MNAIQVVFCAGIAVMAGLAMLCVVCGSPWVGLAMASSAFVLWLNVDDEDEDEDE